MKQTVGIESFMRISAVIPMVALEDATIAPDLARALVRGGIRAIEISLQTAAALHAIEAIARAEPDMCVGAGTVLSISDLHSAATAGASFAVSPGSTPALLAAGNLSTIPYMPGVASASELLAATAAGYRYLSFFPAEAAGGIPMLNALGGPFPQVAFRAAGGIGPEILREYLELPNVLCVAGAWLTPPEALAARDWVRIESLASKTSAARTAMRASPAMLV